MAQGTMELSALPLRCQTCRLGVASLPYSCPFHELRRPAGSVLVQQDEKSHWVWYLRRGQVVLGSTSESGGDLSCAVRGPDTLLGIENLVGQAVPYQISALTDVVLCALDAAAFREWVGSLGTPIGAVLQLALREAGRRVAERHALEGTAVRRVARFLVQRHEADDSGDALHTPQHVLAHILGMRPETLSRALARLRELGVIAPGRGVRVIDTGQLRRLAGA